MKNELRRMLRRNYKRILREELEVKDYEYKKSVTDDAFFAKEVEPLEHSWAGGQNIHHQLDHSEAQGGEPNVRGVETLRITESTLRSIIRQAIVEAKDRDKNDRDDDGDKDFADVMIARMTASGMSLEDAIKQFKE